MHECEERNEPFAAWGPQCQYWDADALPGKRAFDHARAALGSRVEGVVGDFMQCDLASLGTFEVALFLGVLYHMREPLRALERLLALTTELAVIETAAIEIPDRAGALLEFVPGYEVNSDPTNWFLPTADAVTGMCSAAGFGSVSVVDRDFEVKRPDGVVDYRLTVQARP